MLSIRMLRRWRNCTKVNLRVVSLELNATLTKLLRLFPSAEALYFEDFRCVFLCAGYYPCQLQLQLSYSVFLVQT